MSRPFDREDGFALASVVFLGAVMILLTAVIVARATGQSSLENATAQWEQAVHVAEGSLDEYLAGLAVATDPDAIDTGHSIASLPDRASVIAAADALATATPSSVVVAPEGEAVILKPNDARVVFAVGFVPDRTDAGRKARVVMTEYDNQSTLIPNWVTPGAVFAGGDFDMEGSSEVLHTNPAEPGDVHANGSLTLNVASRISGCGTEAVDSSYFQAGCPTAQVAAQPTPVVDATKMHDLAWYDLCADGAHYAPGHPVTPSGIAGSPCSGALTAIPSGWSGGGTAWAVNGMTAGVFYVAGGDVSGSPGIATGPPSSRAPAPMTIIVDRLYGPSETEGACGQGTGGSINFGSRPFMTADSTTINPGEVGIALVAEGAAHVGSSADITGLVLVGEHFSTNGGSTITGPLAAVDNCGLGLALTGNFGLTYTGPVTTPFDAVDPNASGFSVGVRDEM